MFQCQLAIYTLYLCFDGLRRRRGLEGDIRSRTLFTTRQLILKDKIDTKGYRVRKLEFGISSHTEKKNETYNHLLMQTYVPFSWQCYWVISEPIWQNMLGRPNIGKNQNVRLNVWSIYFNSNNYHLFGLTFSLILVDFAHCCSPEL